MVHYRYRGEMIVAFPSVDMTSSSKKSSQLSNDKNIDMYKIDTNNTNQIENLLGNNNIYAKIRDELVEPISANLKTYFAKIAVADEAEFKKQLSAVITNRKQLDLAITQIKNMEAQEDIQSLGLSGFSATLNLTGFKIDLASSTHRKDLMFSIVREYVFDYDLPEYPPVEPSINMFKRTDQTQLCLRFWVLYGFIQEVITKKVAQNPETPDISVLFLLNRLKRLCYPPFTKKPKPNTQPNSKPPNQKPPYNPQQKPAYTPPPQQKPAYNPPQQHGGDMFVDCNIGVVRRIADVMNGNLLSVESQSVSGSVISGEYDFWSNIVGKYINSLPLQDLVTDDFKESIESVPEPEQTGDPKKSKQSRLIDEISSTTGATPDGNTIKYFFDPILNISYSINDVKEYFNIPMVITGQGQGQGQGQGKGRRGGAGKNDKKKPQSHPESNPNKLGANFLIQFKSGYSLPSLVFDITEEELEKIRKRFLKMMMVIFLLLRNAYQEIESKYATTEDDIKKFEQLKKQYSNLDKKLKRYIENEPDKEQKEKLLKIQAIADKNFSNYKL